jgi:RluA family pseudouridine synthase
VARRLGGAVSEPTTRFLVGKREGGKRLDRFLHEKIPGLSRTRIQEAIRERVTLSWGVAARPATPIRAGGEVRIGYTPLPETVVDVALPVLARGAGWLAVDKPPGIPVHPVNRVRENSLIRMLRRQEGHESLRLVHRLDRETSGVLLVAEDPGTASVLSRAFLGGRVRKEYLALVRGTVEGDSGTIALPIGDAAASRVWVRRAAGTGQTARTDWSVERRCDGRTLLRILLGTGRRHQIRVHLEAIGHPVCGDLLYGRDDEAYLRLVRDGHDVRHDEDGPRRQLLHCARLQFPDPVGPGDIEVQAPLPGDFDIKPGTGNPLRRACRASPAAP